MKDQQLFARICQVLRASPVFGMLDDATLTDLGSCLELRSVIAGTVIFREGDTADSMLILLTGRLRVSRQDARGKLSLFNEICPGESVGETGMILHQARTADVTSVRDSTLAVLHSSVFEQLLLRHPLPLNRAFSQAIYNHLRHTPQGNSRQTAQSCAIIPLHGDSEAAEFTRGLIAGFSPKDRVAHVRPDTPGLGVLGPDAGNSELFDPLEDHYDFVLYEARDGLSDWTRRAVRLADQIIFIASSSASAAHGEIEDSLAREPGYQLKRKHLVLLHPPGSSAAGPAEEWRKRVDFERVYLIRSGASEDFRRLIRFLTSNAVAVVLGGGGARGFAHVGFLRALREANIPVDLIGGNSMGALIGAQFACGIPLETILEQTRRFALGGERPTLPVISLLSGRRIERDLKVMFGDVLIDRLWLPYFASACNLSQATTTVQDSGPLWRAVLASNSPAGLLPPVLHKGDLLVDGAILDNVPVSAMRTRLGTPLEKRRGNGTIIAVDVDIRADLGVAPEMNRLSGWHMIKDRLMRSENSLPGIGDILYRAGHIGGLYQRERTIKLADFYFEPPVARFPLMAYRSAAEIAEVGYRYACAQIEKWDRETLGW